jgi:O-acetyl-ADP-ribose deacetylase (regulator of RNase III)
MLHRIFVQRPPDLLPENILALQDQLLSLELAERGVVHVADLPFVPGFPKICLWQGDITRLDSDAIVNAANSHLLGCFAPSHKCIDNVIHSAAGFRLRLACYEMMAKEFPAGDWEEPNGSARITPAFNLPSRFVIRTVGPIVGGQLETTDRQDLASCYQSCLGVATESQCRSIAFCCISTGLFGFPKQQAAEIALQTTTAFLASQETTIDRVIFNVFLPEDRSIYERLFAADDDVAE